MKLKISKQEFIRAMRKRVMEQLGLRQCDLDTIKERMALPRIPRLKWPAAQPRPTTPLRGNVVPLTFDDYVMARSGVGHPAVLKLFRTYGPYRIKPHRNSVGLIWRNQAFWWSSKGYYRPGKASILRRPLQHRLWERAHRRKMPPVDIESLPKDRLITVSEPACGSGAMILSFGEACPPEARRRLRVTATDVNATACHMSFINTTLWGIPAKVIHGNTLSGEVWGAWPNIHWLMPWLPLCTSPCPAQEPSGEVHGGCPDPHEALLLPAMAEKCENTLRNLLPASG